MLKETTGKIKAIRDQVIVELLTEAEKTKGGILLPDQSRKYPTKGKVLSSGPGLVLGGVLVEPEVAEGDIVLFPEFAGTEMEVEGKKLRIMHESEIFAVLLDE